MIVWLVISLLLSACALAPFLVPEDVLFGLMPECPAKANGGPGCILCGMTTAFVAISRGDLSSARHSNAAAIPLYLIFILNLIAVVTVFALILRAGAEKEVITCRC